MDAGGPVNPAAGIVWLRSDATDRRKILEVSVRACKLDQGKRFQSAREMHERLEAIQRSVRGQTGTTASPAARRKLKKVVVAGDHKASDLSQLTSLLQSFSNHSNCCLFQRQRVLLLNIIAWWEFVL